jgi:hypothetical protein
VAATVQFLNDNSGAVTAFATVVLAVATIFYLIESWRHRRAAERQLWDITKPIFGFSLNAETSADLEFRLEIQNVGAPAGNVRLDVFVLVEEADGLVTVERCCEQSEVFYGSDSRWLSIHPYREPLRSGLVISHASETRVGFVLVRLRYKTPKPPRGVHAGGSMLYRLEQGLTEPVVSRAEHRLIRRHTAWWRCLRSWWISADSPRPITTRAH